MGDETYNGWKNYDTWSVNLWLTNDPESAEYLDEMAREEIGYAADNPEDYLDADQLARVNFANRLREELVEAVMAELGASMWADLLTAAFGEIDWIEIAGNAIDAVREEAR